jgi:HAE1 family hydrophobic/amphiphilic exporter-1
MNLRISSWAIKQPLIPFILFISLLFAGIAAYIQLPINNWPDVQIPIVNVSIAMPSASPTEIEAQITRRLEASLATVGNIKHLNSTVTDGVSSTQIEFKSGTNITQALAKVRDKVTEVRPLLPHSAEEPLIQPIDTDLSPILTFAVNAPKRSIEEISWFIDNQVLNTLLAVKGISKIQRQGGQEREIHVDLDPARMQAYNLTADIVNTQIRQTTQTLSAGRLDDKTQEVPIKVAGSHSSIELLASMKIALGDERFAQLQDIGEVHDTVSEPRQLASLNKQPVVAFAIYRSRSASEVSIENAVNQALQQLKANNPDVTFTQIQSQVEFTKRNYHSAVWAFIEGTLLAAMMVYMFLRDWRATAIAGLVIPLSVIPTFIIMQWLGFSLNIVSLLALSLVSGILVDDAIVELENIMRHLRLGKTPYQAAIDAADEIGLAVVSTSAVVIAVFVPVSFMGGVVGKYFSQFGITIAVATFFSLVVARLITPVLAAYFLKPLKEIAHEPAWIASYLQLLERALKNRKKMVYFAGLIFACTLIIVNWLPTEFMAEEDKSQSTLQVELPPGARLADTHAAVTDLTTLLLKQPGVKSVYALVGGADSETNVAGEIRQATLTIGLKPPSERPQNIKLFEQHMLKVLSNVPNVRIGFLNENGSKALTIGLSSDDSSLLQLTATALEEQMRGMSQLNNVSANTLLPRTELVVTPRNDDAARLGVNVENISDTIRIATMGDLKVNLAKLNVDNRQVPIRVLLNSKAKDDPSIISHLLVPSLEGALVPLSEVADVTLGAGAASITRYDQRRQIMLEADLNNVTLGEALDLIEELPAIKNLPASIKRIDTGDAEMLAEMFNSFSTAMVAGVVTVFLVLVLLFRTLLQPATIMFSLPLSICGALLALLLTGYALSLPAIIGILMLMGIVAKNGILLVDFIIENRASGIGLHASVINACRQRSRPIVMTSLAMIAGMLPIILGIGAGTAFRTPMALTVVGGLISSTVLSLLFIPVLYTLINDFELWLSPKLKSLTTL